MFRKGIPAFNVGAACDDLPTAVGWGGRLARAVWVVRERALVVMFDARGAGVSLNQQRIIFLHHSFDAIRRGDIKFPNWFSQHHQFSNFLSRIPFFNLLWHMTSLTAFKEYPIDDQDKKIQPLLAVLLLLLDSPRRLSGCLTRHDGQIGRYSLDILNKRRLSTQPHIWVVCIHTLDSSPGL